MTTHTFAVLQLSPEAFAEIKDKLEKAGYQDQFLNEGKGLMIDMHGIAMKEKPKKVVEAVPTVITCPETAYCMDCSLFYTKFGMDLVLPDQQWKIIAPEGGLLCPTCICRRAAKLGGTAVLGWVNNLNYSEKDFKHGQNQISSDSSPAPTF